MEVFDRVAFDAINCFNVSLDKIERLGQSDNITFRVNTTMEDASFLLKIHNPSNTINRIESELKWVEALSKESDLIVPSPFRNKNGDLVSVIKSNDYQERYVTMQHWVKGNTLGRQPATNEIQKLASLMSTLHKHSKQWIFPNEFSRGSYEPKDILSYYDKAQMLIDMEIVDSSSFIIVHETIEIMLEELNCLEKTKDTWGLIHSDLHEGNYVFYHNDEARPIDFSACGFGFFLFDVAETLLHLIPDNRKLYIECYGKQNIFPENYIRILETLFLWQIMRGIAFHSANPLEYKWLSKHIPNVANIYCKKYIKGDSFLLY